MKISQNYPNSKAKIFTDGKKGKKDPDLWKKEVEEINKILQNFEHVSIV